MSSKSNNIFADMLPHKSFANKKAMDEAVRAFLYRYKASLSRATVNVLKFVWRHSVRVTGVSCGRLAYIAEGVGVSRRTVIRAINTLEEYGVIKRVPTVRPNGKRGVNLLVLQAVEGASLPAMSPQNDTANVTPPTATEAMCDKRLGDEKATETLEKQSYRIRDNNVNKDVEDVEDLEHQEQAADGDTWHLPPQPFAAAVRPFSALIEPAEAWRKVTIARREAALEGDDIIHTAIHAFKATVAAYKTGRIRKDAGGYFYGCLRNLFAAERRREVMATAGYDWVAAAMMGG